jgi:hypothetical protein
MKLKKKKDKKRPKRFYYTIKIQKPIYHQSNIEW